MSLLDFSHHFSLAFIPFPQNPLQSRHGLRPGDGMFPVIPARSDLPVLGQLWSRMLPERFEREPQPSLHCNWMTKPRVPRRRFIAHVVFINCECSSFWSHRGSVGMAATSTDPHFDHDPQQPQPQRGPDGSAVLWALYTQSEIITNLFLNWIPPHDFILGVEIMALNQNTLLMTSARTDLPLRYNMTSYVHFTVYLCSSRYPEALGRVNEQINKLNEGTDPKSLSRVCFSMLICPRVLCLPKCVFILLNETLCQAHTHIQ